MKAFIINTQLMKQIQLLSYAIPILVVLLLNSGCDSLSSRSDGLPVESRLVIFESHTDSGLLLVPGHTKNFSIAGDEKKYPVRQSIRVKGFCILPGPFSHRGEEAFRNFAFHIDDYLDSLITYRERYSLVFMGNGESLERNAFYRLSGEELRFFKGKKIQVSIPVKTDNLVIPENGYMQFELQVYRKKTGRHPDDIYDQADQVNVITISAGGPEWFMVSGEVEIPADIACILFKLGSKDISGKCYVGTPSLIYGNTTLKLHPFEPYAKNGKNWIGENLSSKEWPEFEISIDGRVIFAGKVFDRASNVGDFEVELPQPVTGKAELSIRLRDGFPARYPYTIKSVEWVGTGAHNFEVAAIPQFIHANRKFAVLLDINQPGIKLKIKTSKNIRAERRIEEFTSKGLHALPFTAAGASLDQFVELSSGMRKVKFAIPQIIAKKEDGVYISTGDDIYIDKNFRKFSEYIIWYVREGIGNSYCWRPSEQWSDAGVANPEFYGKSVGILSSLQMPYSLMIEGRTIAGRNINPEESWMKGPFYMGRQAHENDGGYYYWNHFKWEWLHSDLLAKYRPQGGIFAKNRPIRNDRGTFVFLDPFRLKNMEEGPEYFIDNLRKAKGNSIRHTGPSTMFRYLFRAGYEWLGAEQMYGPEEVIMSSLRGASRAYGKEDYGTHLATQWGSGPYDTPEHASRLFLSLAISYIHGASHINVEEGLWNTEPGFDRFSQSGKEHIKAQRDMFSYIQTHERRGSLVTPVAVLQGRNDAWKSFGRDQVWSQKEEEWNFGPAEESFDLLKVFYPGNRLEPIYKFPAPKSPQGWYSSTPFGLIDLLPVEAPPEVLEKYKVVAFLGWNTYNDDDFRRLTGFVRTGKTLLLTGAHLNSELVHNKPVTFPKNDSIIKGLLGENYKSASQPYENKVGEGKVIFFPEKEYPVKGFRDQYVQTLRKISIDAVSGESGKGWIENSPCIEFAAWDWKDKIHRTIYLLNIDWWSDTLSHSATLLLGAQRFQIDVRRNWLETITISDGIAIMPASITTEILAMETSGNKCMFTVQSTGKDMLKVFSENNSSIRTILIKKPGIHKIELDI